MTDDRRDEVYYAALDLLKEQVRCLAPTQGAEATLNLWEQRLGADDYHVHRAGKCLWTMATPYDESLPTLLLEAHIDTTPGVGRREGNPYEPIEDECCIYGAGVRRCIAPAVSLWAAMRLLSTTQQPYNLAFMLVCGGSVPCASDMEQALSEMPRAHFAIVGLPTAMQPAISERGFMQVECTVEAAGGAVAANENENALYKALPLLSTLQEYHFEKLSVSQGEVKMSVTTIDASAPKGMLPTQCRFVLEVRANDCYTNEELLTDITRLVPDCSLRMLPGATNPSYVDDRHPFVRRAELLGCEPFGSSAQSDRSCLSCRSVAMGPGSPEPDEGNEHIAEADLREAIELFVNLLDGMVLPLVNE